MSTDFGQWEIMKKLAHGIDIGVNPEQYMRKGNNPSGTPYTLYDLDETRIKGHDELFLRIDNDVNGYYLSIRQYQKYTNEKVIKQTGISDPAIARDEKMKRLNFYIDCYKTVFIKYDFDITFDYIETKTNHGFESEIAHFDIDDVKTLCWLELNLANVISDFLDLVSRS